MRCNRHVSDYSSSVGVCASCLRERLFTLIAAQVEENRRKTEDRRKAATEANLHHQHSHPAPPLVFPRSVSPYICRRSDDSSWHNNDRRFYSTPQLGPTHSASLPTRRKRGGKFSLLSTLFRSSRSLQAEAFSDPRVSTGSLPSSTSSPMSSSSSSSSWFSSLLSGRRKKTTTTSRFDEAPQPVRHHRRARDRGMSPTNVDRDFDPDEASGYSSESSPGWRKSAPATTVPARRRGSNLNKNVTGMAFCLSPLVRASPNNHRCQKDVSVPTVGISGEIARKTTAKHISTAASLCANRSRKLADMGRYSYKS